MEGNTVWHIHFDGRAVHHKGSCLKIHMKNVMSFVS